MTPDLSAFTLPELQEMLATYKGELRQLLQGHGSDGASFTRRTLAEVTELLNATMAELRRRDPATYGTPVGRTWQTTVGTCLS